MPLAPDYRGLLSASPTAPMTKVITEMFIRMMMSTPDHAAFIDKEFRAKEVPCYVILCSHLDAMNVKVALPLRIFMGAMIDRPGQAVLWAFTLAHLCKEKGDRELTMEDIGFEFPLGFPTEQAEERVWRAQKMTREEREKHGGFNDNWIDRAETWPQLTPLPKPVPA